jgi:SAM-dependent methyltransferase
LPDEDKRRLLREAARVLRPGGRLFVHVLVANRPLGSEPRLPGPAAAVRHVPLEAEPRQLVEDAGLTRVELLKFDPKPCLVQDGVEMRELQLAAWKAV